MSDTIEHIHDPLFRCSSVKKTDADRKSGGYSNFNKRKKKDGNKGEKDCRRPISYTGQIKEGDLRGVKSKEPDETRTEENRCGKIIDVEA